MLISTKGRYALRMMVDIAENQVNGYVTLKDVAARQDISKKYLEQIALHLSQAGMLRAVRGYQGGYMLAREPGEITVGEKTYSESFTQSGSGTNIKAKTDLGDISIS